MADWNPNLVPSKLTPVGLTCLGQFHISTPISTAITAGVPTKLLGTTTAGPLKGWSHTNGRLTYEGSKRTPLILGTIEAKADNNAMDTIVYLALNGVIIPLTRGIRRLPAAGQCGIVAINTYVDVQRGDFLEIFVDSDINDSLTSNNSILSVAG